MLRKYAHAEILGVGYDFVGLTKVAHRAVFEYQPRKGFLYIRSRAISSRTNDNYDTFPADELRKAWASFIGKPVFVNHNNEDIGRRRGVIIDAALHDDKGPDGTDDTWIEVLMEIDALNFPKLALALINGDIERTSMGTDVLVSKCSYCGNEARTPDQYCPHVARMKGQRLRRKNASTGAIEDVLVHEICSGLSFFENSLLVEDPADPTAYTFGLDVRGILEEDEFADKLAKVASFKTAADTNRPGRGGRGPRGNPWDDFYAKKVGQSYEVRDKETDVQLGVVWRGKDGWYGQTMDGTKAVEGYPGSMDTAIGVVAREGRGKMASKTAAVALDEDQRTRFKGVGVDKDDDGYYCKTHRCRSDSYPSVDEIPDTAIAFIESTGARMAGKAPKAAENNLRDAWKTQGWDRISDLAETGWDGFDVAGMASKLGVPVSDVETAVANGKVIRDAFRTKQDQRWRDRGFVPDESRPGNWMRPTAAIDLGVPTEVRVPPEVETLRAPQCPVCDSDASWNADGRCGVCGYLPPPQPFRAPDTDVAGRADQSGGWFDPELTRATPFNLNPVQSSSSTVKDQRLTQGVPMASVATAARQRITADRALASENAQLREQIARLTAGRKTADIDNPAQPVTEPAAQPAAPVDDADATIDVETPGGVVAPPDLSVPGDVTTPGSELPASEAPSTDVTAPVAGGSDVQDSTTEVKPNADGDGLTPNAFGGDWINGGSNTIPSATSAQRAIAGRMQAQVRDRIWASVRLARLRIQSGIAEEHDDLMLGRSIEGSKSSLEAIQAESSALALALKNRPAVRQPQRTATRAPSLAAGAQPIVGLASRDAREENLFE